MEDCLPRLFISASQRDRSKILAIIEHGGRIQSNLRYLTSHGQAGTVASHLRAHGSEYPILVFFFFFFFSFRGMGIIFSEKLDI